VTSPDARLSASAYSERAATADVIRNAVWEAHVRTGPGYFSCQHDAAAFAGAQLPPVPQTTSEQLLASQLPPSPLCFPEELLPSS